MIGIILAGSATALEITAPSDQKVFSDDNTLTYELEIPDGHENVTVEIYSDHDSEIREYKNEENSSEWSSGTITDDYEMGEDGVYEINASAVDQDENEDSTEVIDFFYDTEAPEFALDDSSPYPIATRKDITSIEAVFTDDTSGIKEATIELYGSDDVDEDFIGEETASFDVGENEAGVSIDPVDYRDDEDLEQGNYEVECSAEDHANQSLDGECGWEFTVDAEYQGPTSMDFDPSPGTIEVDTGTNDIEASVNTTGDELTQKDYTCMVDGEEVDNGSLDLHEQNEDTEVTFTCEIPAEYSGENFEFLVELTDQSNGFAATNEVEYGFDAYPPEIDVLSPADDATTFNDDFVMEYEASDDVSGVDDVEYFLGDDPGEGEANSLPDTEGNFEIDTAGMSAGPHTLSIRAVDEVERWSDIETFGFDYAPDEQPQLEIEIENNFEAEAEDTTVMDVDLTNTGDVVVPSGHIDLSDYSDGASYDSISPGDSSTFGISISPTSEDLGEQTIIIDPNSVDASKETTILVTADEESRNVIDTKLDSYYNTYQNMSDDIEDLNTRLNENRSSRINSSFEEFESSVQEAQEAVEDGEYYRASEILDNVEENMENAQQTVSDVEEEQRVENRNRYLIIIFGVLILIGLGAWYVNKSEKYEFDFYRIKLPFIMLKNNPREIPKNVESRLERVKNSSEPADRQTKDTEETQKSEEEKA